MCGSRTIIIIIIPILVLSRLYIQYTTCITHNIYERRACRSICRPAHFVVKLGQLIIIAVSSIRVSMTIPLRLSPVFIAASLSHSHSPYIFFSPRILNVSFTPSLYLSASLFPCQSFSRRLYIARIIYNVHFLRLCTAAAAAAAGPRTRSHITL